VLWRALHDLAIAASPALVFTADEVWQHHAALRGESPSVHLARWPDVAAPPAAEAGEWDRLLALRAEVNAVIEPLRAVKTMNTTQEAEVLLRLPAAERAWAEGYGAELAGFLMVSQLSFADEAAGSPRVGVSRTAHPKCERCWTYRPDVADAPGGALCGRCADALRLRGGP
jgi:isoleucyl-tRNA synthetase